MAIEVPTIPRVYIKDASHWQSAHHTCYLPAPALPDAKPGTEQALVTLVFEMGIARNVPTQVYAMFAAANMATTDRPKRRWEEDDEPGR